MSHPDLAGEQAFLDHAYDCLRFMQERAVHLKSLGYQGGNVGEGGYVAPEARQAWDADKQRRIDELAEVPSALCFGRIDRVDDHRFYIGRRHVEDEHGEPVVTDWRAPVATPFYRATLADPMELRRRRRFLVEARQLVDLFDEDLDDPAATVGTYVPDPLLAEIERGRTGEMRDIVATIQAEQDVIIRAPIEECIVVQGGPGTGKTAVGLHRAAFLLYEHREVLERHRLLIVGPNRVFLRYISQVLPSLGETASVQVTVEGLIGSRFRVRAEDPPDVERLKGDARMGEVVRRAVFGHMTPPAGDARIATSFGMVTVPATELAERVHAALTRDRPTNQSRAVLRDQFVELAWRAYATRPTADIAQKDSFVDEVRAGRQLKAVVDRAWPALTPSRVIRRLYGNRAVLNRATAGLLADAERDALARRPSRKVSDEQWTRADQALLDEAAALIDGVARTYGHVVVDEAQDLSAIELRVIARRSRGGSLTVLGDLAQATSPGSQTDWMVAIKELDVPKPRFEELTVGYRVPAPVMDFANRLLPEAAPRVRPATSVRLRGEAPRLVAVDSPAGLAAAAAAEVVDLAERWGSVAVVVPTSMLAAVDDALATAHVEFTDTQKTASLGEHVTVLSPTATKGLEFDAVLAVEPARIVDEEANGLRVLYIVLTRAVQQLTVVHAAPLPAALAG